MAAQKDSYFRVFQLMLQPSSSLSYRLRYLRPPLAKAMSTSTPIIKPPFAIDEAIDEETIINYNPNNYFSIHPGQVLNNRYQAITKLGWGFGSTVWLAEDLSASDGPYQPFNSATSGTTTNKEEHDTLRYVAVKVGTSAYSSVAAAEHELKISRHIALTNPSHPGAGYIRSPINNFRINGPQGIHVCLVYHPMRETLYALRHRFRNRRLSPRILRLYIALLLQGLNYLHSECHLIHTDLKEDNILVDLECDSVLEDFVKQQKEIPLPRHTTNDGHITYLSQSDFGPLRDYFILPEIADLDLAQFGNDGTHIHPVQPHRYRAPEVILGTGWSYGADIWNLGVLIWNLMEGKDLFVDLKGENGQYNAHAHLAQMIALLGPPPIALLQQERIFRKLTFTPEIRTPEGQPCRNTCHYFGGPFFDDNGEFIRKDIIPRKLEISETITFFRGEEKKLFLDFVGKMLQWQPEQRSTAKDLLEDPFLQFEDDLD